MRVFGLTSVYLVPAQPPSVLRTFTSPYCITGVRGRVPLEFYAVNVQNRHIGPGGRALRSQVARARNPRDELYASIRSCALIYYPCNRGPPSLFSDRAAVSCAVYASSRREIEREKKKKKVRPAKMVAGAGVG